MSSSQTIHITLSNIISLNFFLSTDSNVDYDVQKKKVNDCLSDHFKTQIPIAYLAQAPADGKCVSIEAHYIPNLNGTEVISKSLDGVNYLVVTNSIDEKLVIANGICVGNAIHNIEKLISRETLSSIDQNLTVLPKIKFSGSLDGMVASVDKLTLRYYGIIFTDLFSIIS